jgi:hypothetical protein
MQFICKALNISELRGGGISARFPQRASDPKVVPMTSYHHGIQGKAERLLSWVFFCANLEILKLPHAEYAEYAESLKS